MINITTEQAKLILQLIDSDIQSSEFSEPDYTDTKQLCFYFDRAVLRDRILTAINSSEGGA